MTDYNDDDLDEVLDELDLAEGDEEDGIDFDVPPQLGYKRPRLTREEMDTSVERSIEVCHKFIYPMLDQLEVYNRLSSGSLDYTLCRQLVRRLIGQGFAMHALIEDLKADAFDQLAYVDQHRVSKGKFN